MNKKEPKHFIQKMKKKKNSKMNMKEPKEFIQEIYIPCTLQLSLLVFMEMLTIKEGTRSGTWVWAFNISNRAV